MRAEDESGMYTAADASLCCLAAAVTAAPMACTTSLLRLFRTVTVRHDTA